MDRRNNELKLPTIASKVRDGSKIFSSTMVDNVARSRLSSLSKVQDLERKLFSKLDSYEITSKKPAARKISKKGKLGQIQNGSEPITDGYDKLQKVMPALYNKLVQAKKGSIIDLASIETPSKSQADMSKKIQHCVKESSTTQATTRDRSRVSMFTVEKEATAFSLDESDRINDGVMSQQEMEEWYRNYQRDESLSVDTSSQELRTINQSLLSSELQIQQLTKSMQGLIRQIGMEYLSSCESQLESNDK